MNFTTIDLDAFITIILIMMYFCMIIIVYYIKKSTNRINQSKYSLDVSQQQHNQIIGMFGEYYV